MSIQPITGNYGQLPQLPPPVYGQPPVGTQPSTLTEGDTFNQIGGYVGSAGGGGFASFKLNGAVAANYKNTLDMIHNGSGVGNTFKALFTGTKEFAKISFKAAGLSALVGGGVSVVVNGYQAATGKITGGTAAGNIAADAVTSAVGGVGAVAVGGTVTWGLGKFLSGTPLAIIGIGAGIAGSVLATHLIKKTGIDQGIRDGVKGMFGS